MIIKLFLALPLFTKDEQSLFENICMEFISGTSGLCTDNGNNPVYLMYKVLAVVRADTAPGGNKQHTYHSGAARKKYPPLPFRSRKNYLLWVFLMNHAMFSPSCFIVSIPSSSVSTSPGLRPFALFQ
jgi:hypothetical protein